MSNVERQPLDAPVIEVTLMEDRARVVRRGKVKLEKDLNRLVLPEVSTIICDKSLASRIIEAPDGTRTASLRVRRERVVHPEDQPKDAAALTNLRREVGDQLGKQKRTQTLLEQELRLLQNHRSQSLIDLSVDVSWGRTPTAIWSESLDRSASQEKALRLQILDSEKTLRDLTQRLVDVEARISASSSPRTTERASLEVDVWAPAEAVCTIQLEYVVPNACWRPYHTAHLRSGTDGGPATLRFDSDGCVWQNTGEEWRGVKLFFSTQRPSLGAEPPVLSDDLLRTEPKAEQIVVEQREKEIQTAGLGAGEERLKTKATDELPGIDDGGQALVLAASTRADVPSDGRPHRVPVFSFETTAPTQYICMPEKADAVFLRSEQSNLERTPILAGPVDLIRDHGLVGRTSLLFVAPGEKFELGWGPEHALRVNRTFHEKEPEDTLLNALKSWTVRERRIVIRLSNLGGETYHLKVQERIPVSEIDKVVIEPDVKGTTGQVKPDANGILTWNPELPARRHLELVLRYLLKKDKQVAGV